MKYALALGLMLAAHAAQAEEITVFAASSMQDALDQIIADYEATSDDTITVSYAGTSTLGRQLQEGAPANLFISASNDWMDKMIEAGIVAPETARPIAGNILVLIGPAGTPPVDPATLPDALGEGYLAMATIDAVPAGIYGKAALETLGVFEAVVPHIVQADNVRAAMSLVALGEAEMGIVYGSDAFVEPKVQVIAELPVDDANPIVYPAAIVGEGDTEAARAFFDYLASDAAQARFAELGFTKVGP